MYTHYTGTLYTQVQCIHRFNVYCIHRYIIYTGIMYTQVQCVHIMYTGTLCIYLMREEMKYI